MAAIGVSSRSSAAASGSSQGAKLSDQRYVIFGAGSAGMGIAVQVRDAMVTADKISRAEANRRFWLIDREGLLYDHTGEQIEHQHEWSSAKEEFVRPFEEGWGEGKDVKEGGGNVSLLETIKRVKPTVLIGCSTAAGAFSEGVVKAMSEGLTNGEKPIIMPLSNPSRLVEAKPVDIMRWTGGRALVATGSPFGTVEMKVDGKDKSFRYVADAFPP
jgi:malate dehydrogenase (oxaloacetate-decarboxylating)